ncbi:MAG: hypothetical protein HYZ31_11600 [Gammaproteobacteria bacterium]|nr:hypothetical protein [Gammaproteobacteria bacterium]
MGEPVKTSAEKQTSDFTPANRSNPFINPAPFSSVDNLTQQYSSSSMASSSDWSFDPYAEEVQVLTNDELVTAIYETEDWLAASGMVALDYDAYLIRKDRLEEERKRRVGLGHLWLETIDQRQCETLVQTIPGQNGASDVVQVENNELVNGLATDISASPIMTNSQFRGSIAGQGVPTVSVAEYLQSMSPPDYGYADAGLDPNYGLSGAVAMSNIRANLLQQPFSLRNANDRQGQIGEVYFGTSADSLYGFGVSDYNAKPWTHPTRGVEVGNYPVVDYQSLFGDAMPEKSVKTTRSTSANPFERYKTYMDGYAQMMNTQPGYRGFTHYMNNSANGRTAAQVRDQLSLVINADDVAGFRQFVANPFARETTPTGKAAKDINHDRPALKLIYDGILQDRPYTLPDGSSFTSIDQLNNALKTNVLTAAQHQAAINTAAQAAASKIQANPEHTHAVQTTFANARNAIPNRMTPADVRAANSPEYMYSLSKGGGWRGDFHAMRSYGGKGALFGSLMGVGREGYSMLTDDQANPDALQRLAWVGGREGLRGGATSSLETLAASRTSRYALERGLAASSTRAIGMRLGARFIPGGFVDGAFAAGDMATDNRDNSGPEVAYRMGRAFVIGGTSALAGATAGAWAGTAIGTAIFPGVGTVIGFVVGVLVGALVGFIMSSIIPDYEEMVMEQVPLKEFENNINAQTPASIQNQVLAEQELALALQLVHGPESRGPHNMFDMYRRRNVYNSPGYRMYAEAMIGDEIHGGCMDCHTQKAIADYDAQFDPLSEAWMAPVDRMYLAGQEESRRGARPKFLNWDVPGQTVPPWLVASMANDPDALTILNSVNVIQPNFAGWRDIMGSKGNGIIPPHAMNSPMDEQELYDAIRGNINFRQAYFEFFFGEVGADEYKLYGDALQQWQDKQNKK